MTERRETSLPPSAKTTDLTADSDYDLLEMMAWKDTDPAIAIEAWAEFYRRHVTYFFGVCRRFTNGMGGDVAAEDLVEETFKRVYHSGAATFKPGPSRVPEDMRKHVLGWLARIAENLAKDAFAAGGTGDYHLEQEHWQDVPDQSAPVESEATRRVRDLMDSVLTERERFVLRVKFHWHKLGNDNQRLPNEVAVGLAAQLKTTPANVRQIASRAYRKIRDAILRITDGSSFTDKDADEETL